jgi:DNA-binding transcriptional LysR family regulator
MMIAKKHQFDWDDLRIFNAVVDSGSLRGASLQLSVNHSTVFRRLNRLEAAIGARLFDRLPEGYSLTQVGEELRTHAVRVREDVTRHDPHHGAGQYRLCLFACLL